MDEFRGFQDERNRPTPVPFVFFTQLLNEMDHLGELKILLYTFWRLDYSEGKFRYLRLSDYQKDKRLMAGLGANGESSEQVLEESLEKAVAHRLLLQADVRQGDKQETLFFLNTPVGKAAVAAIQAGKWRFSGQPRLPVEVLDSQPNIYRLYEENIGPLSPMIADMLRDAEQDYPPPWIEDALRIAVKNNKRNWRYVETILKRWQQEGRDDRKDRRDSEEARRRYAEWETPHFDDDE